MTILPTDRADTTPATIPLRFRDRVNTRRGAEDLLVFRIGAEQFAVDLQSVDEAVDSPIASGVPESQAFVRGVFAHDHEFLPLFDTAALLGMPAAEQPSGAALVMRGRRRRIGLAIDDVEDVVRVEFSELRDVPVGSWNDDLVLAVLLRGRDVVALLDARAVITACQSGPTLEAL